MLTGCPDSSADLDALRRKLARVWSFAKPRRSASFRQSENWYDSAPVKVI